MATREQYYAMIHMGANRLGFGEDSNYRAWLENLTGKRSCKDCSEQELATLVTTLRACQALENPNLKHIKGGCDGNRPSAAQWNMANSLCRKLGMTGCDDARFAAFAKRNAKVDHPRFLKKNSMIPLIAGLQRWLNNLAEKDKQK